MKDILIIGAACAAAIAVGAWLYFEDGSSPLMVGPAGPVTVVVLAEGQDSGNLSERKNYRLRSREELTELARLMYGTGGPVFDTVNFGKEEVLAVFDGSHSSGGYTVEVVSVEDTATTRKVVIRRTAPGDSCMTTSALTSPFVLVRLPSTPLPIERIDETITRECE